MAPGEMIVYHRGFLADDRIGNAGLDALAREALRLSTAWCGILTCRETA